MLNGNPLMDVLGPHVNDREWVVQRLAAMARLGWKADVEH